MTMLDEWTLSLLQNEEVLRLENGRFMSRQVLRDNEKCVWASVDPKTVQYLAGHENSKITMDIYAKVKYNRPEDLVISMDSAFTKWNSAYTNTQ